MGTMTELLDVSVGAVGWPEDRPMRGQEFVVVAVTATAAVREEWKVIPSRWH